MGKLSGLGCSLAALLAPAAAWAQWLPANPVTGSTRIENGAEVSLAEGVLRLEVCGDSIIRVRYAPARPFSPEAGPLVVKASWPSVPFSVEETNDAVTLRAPRVAATVTRKDGALVFSDSSGAKLAQENTRILVPVDVNGEKTHRAERFTNLWDSQESFYGLGQHQAGVWDYRGESVDISQDNTNISVPLLVSSKGYGIFWNNSSRSRMNNRFVHALYLSSEVADAIDYYFLYGPELDRVIASYRDLTGPAPLFGKWAYGFFQSKNRYESQEEILRIARGYRERHLPLDTVVQDWFWWNTMGEPVFNKNYPDPRGMVDELHKSHVRLMISVWPFFRRGSPVYEEMDRRGFFVDRTKVAVFHPEGMALYDAFNPEARHYVWKLLDDALFKLGVDAWWLDTTEPETEGRETPVLATNRVALGNGARYANAYPLYATETVYEGQRAETDRKRVFILSRSGFAGIQRHATAVWSGDLNPTWEALRRQIPAGLNLSLSGIPYWTTDIGGFVNADPRDPDYRELFVRWFEFGSFCPVFRVHGTRATNENEIWSYGEQAEGILAAFDRLRYRLLPYLYSVAWKTSSEGYTPMRALALDFRSDPRALATGDEFLLGPALLVSPVTELGARSRSAYVPCGTWYDFWTGGRVEGGGTRALPAPLERLPLLVRAGSILPLGPSLEYADEHPADPIEVRVYEGASGSFTLYEDDGESYDYEKGRRATIRFDWDDHARVLGIGAQEGTFPGAPATRTFRVVFVAPGHGDGARETEAPDRTVSYAGKAISVSR
jgi:alpha-D-xyloside xylohydrolase